jgi:hypothetical protein
MSSGKQHFIEKFTPPDLDKAYKADKPYKPYQKAPGRFEGRRLVF